MLYSFYKKKAINYNLPYLSYYPNYPTIIKSDISISSSIGLLGLNIVSIGTLVINFLISLNAY